MTWSIQGEGTFAELGLERLQKRQANQVADTVTFSAPVADMAGTALFAYDDEVVILKEDAQWFRGRCVTVPREGSDDEESIEYEFQGAWRYFEECTYEQLWRIWDTTQDQLIWDYKPRLILCQDEEGDRITTGQQIQDVVDFLVARGAPLQVGDIDPDVQIPWEEQTNLKCSQVIQLMLRWTPDCVVWFDYSTTPITFHCRRRANLQAKSIDIAAGAPNQLARISPRNDLQVPGVKLWFEQTHVTTVDGGGPDDPPSGTLVETTVTDEAGDVDALRAVRSLITLAGSRLHVMTQRIKTEDWPTQEQLQTNKQWWMDRVPALADMGQVDFTILSATRAPGNYDKILVEGQIQEWMDVETEDDVATVVVDITVRDDQGVIVKKEHAKEFYVKRTSTDAATGTDNEKLYDQVASYEGGEPIPTGLAAELLAEWSELQYDGMVVLSEQDPSGNIAVGNVMNLTGGKPAWETMRALVQQVIEDVETGETTIVFGPAKHLELDDLLSLLHRFRSRRTAYGYRKRTTGLTRDDAAGGGGGGQVGGKGPAEEHGDAPAEIRYQRMRNDDGDKEIILDPVEMPDTDEASVQIKAREIEVCEDGVLKKMQILCSETYI